MSPSKKHGELQEKIRNKQDLDRISCLPDEIIGNILSFLTTKNGVSTSVLSTKWKHLFRLTTNLSFDDSECLINGEVEEEKTEENEAAHKKSFVKFINRVLALHQISPIKKFTLYCRYQYEIPLLHGWINSALQKGVRELHLQLYNQPDEDPPPSFFDSYYQFMQPNAFPPSFFSSKTLVVLKIRSYIYHFEVPEFVSLPSLKILHMKSITFQDSVGRFLSGCPVLEELNISDCLFIMVHLFCISVRTLKDLSLENCSTDSGVVTFDAPNLVYLTYEYNTCVGVASSSKELCSLVKAELACRFNGLEISNNQLTLALVRAAYNAADLHVLEELLYCLTLAEDDKLPSYPNLERLHLDCVPFTAWKYLIHWLSNSPRLETVVFREVGNAKLTPDIAQMPFLSCGKLVEVLMPFTSCVKVIEVYQFYGYEPVVVLLKHLLRNAGELKKLILHRCYCRSRPRKHALWVKRELMAVRRASNHCNIAIELL